MVRHANATHYQPITWSEAFAMIAEELNRLDSPNQACFYTCPWRIVIPPLIPWDFPSCYHSSMRNLAVLFIHLIAVLARLPGPCGVRSVVAESVPNENSVRPVADVIPPRRTAKLKQLGICSSLVNESRGRRRV